MTSKGFKMVKYDIFKELFPPIYVSKITLTQFFQALDLHSIFSSQAAPTKVSSGPFKGLKKLKCLRLAKIHFCHRKDLQIRYVFKEV